MKEPKKTFSYFELYLFSFNHFVFFFLSSSPLSLHSYILAHSLFHLICITPWFQHMGSRHPETRLCLCIICNLMNQSMSKQIAQQKTQTEETRSIFAAQQLFLLTFSNICTFFTPPTFSYLLRP